MVHGLIEGDNTLVASAGGKRVVQRIRAWPLTGPIISGPHLPLLACSTEEHGLGAPTDADCSAPSKVSWRYITTKGQLAPLPDPEAKPDDLATAAIGGEQVPLYVRYEQGVINRSVYEVASIDPTPGDRGPHQAPDGTSKLLYRFGGGCGTTYGQGTSLTSALEPAYLRQGYAVATATFNTFQVQCNDVLSAETVMMVKERIIEELGEPRFTIGEGASGGAIQLHLLAQDYPGLVNGIVAALPFPDALSISPGVTDCGLLLHYYGSTDGKGLTEAQRTAINGHATSKTCQTWSDTFLPAIDPTVGCDPKIPKAKLYDPATNPSGLRCTLQDANRNQMGTDPETGFAERPLDNVGVQYGLEALNAKQISVEQFLDLNAGIGGYDIDGRITSRREEASAKVLEHVYETGRISMGGGDQRAIPIIDLNVFTDATGDIHDRFRAFSLRDRLAGPGSPDAAPGYQIWTREPGSAGLGPALSSATSGGTLGVEAVKVVDAWLTGLAADTQGGPIDAVLRRTRPKAAVDSCLPKGATTPIVGLETYTAAGPCRDDLPLAGDPRTAAGAPPLERGAQVRPEARGSERLRGGPQRRPARPAAGDLPAGRVRLGRPRCGRGRAGQPRPVLRRRHVARPEHLTGPSGPAQAGRRCTTSPTAMVRRSPSRVSTTRWPSSVMSTAVPSRSSAPRSTRTGRPRVADRRLPPSDRPGAVRSGRRGGAGRPPARRCGRAAQQGGPGGPVRRRCRPGRRARRDPTPR